MPVDMSRYPDNWNQIRDRILRRAGGEPDYPAVDARCEWCGVRNYSVGYRDDRRRFVHYADADQYSHARDVADTRNAYSDERYVVIVLTIAHVYDHDPQNVDSDNLAALCQRCHNRHDAEMRKTHAAETRRRQEIEAGQLVLF